MGQKVAKVVNVVVKSERVRMDVVEVATGLVDYSEVLKVGAKVG